MIDLHIHSKASDGTDDIDELLDKIREAGITTFAVTDHDTIEGAMEMEGCAHDDMTFIRGIEFSCITEAGKCHILGYGYDWNARPFRELLEEGRKRRRKKLESRLEYLKSEFGIEFSDSELEKLRMMSSVGKPHLGNLLVSKGYANDRRSAIEKYINPCKTESARLDGIKVIKAILASGGIPVWAHPLGGTDEREITIPEFEKQLKVLMEAGIQGLECYYSKYTEEQVSFLVNTARRNDLLISGGSDYHGGNKSVRLGELCSSDIVVNESMLTVVAKIREKAEKRREPLLEIVEGPDLGAYFWIEPVKIQDIGKQTDNMDNKLELEEELILIEEDIMSDFLYLIFKRHFDNELPANKMRSDEYALERYTDGIAFEWNLTDNYYTLDGIRDVIKDIQKITELLKTDPKNRDLDFMREGLRELGYYKPRKGAYNASITEEDVEKLAEENMPELIDFYKRFCSYLEQMIKAAEENGYDLISVSGP